MALATACSSTSEPRNPPVDQPLPDAYADNRGQEIPTANITGNVPVEWAGSTELLYFTVALTQLVEEIRAVNISSQATRVLHRGGNIDGYSGYSDLAVSPDGQRVFASLSKPLTIQHDLIHLGDSLSSVLIRVNPLTGSGDVMLPTPDSKAVVYGVGTDSMKLYDVNTRTSRRLGEGCNTPRAFSPDGGTLLCQRGNDYLIMSVTSGSTMPLSRLGLVVSAFWGAGGAELLIADIHKLSLVKANTGSATVLLEDNQLRSFEVGDYFNAQRSRDGRKVAIPSNRNTTILGPTSETVLYVIDTETLKMDRVAVVKTGSDSRIRTMAFSPDGKSIAYVVGNSSGGSVYLSHVP